jgi:hypothetical protein
MGAIVAFADEKSSVLVTPSMHVAIAWWAFPAEAG